MPGVTIKKTWHGDAIQAKVMAGAMFALYNVGPRAVETAKSYAPEKTGALKESISFDAKRSGNILLTLKLICAIYYGLYQEMGFHLRNGEWHEGVHFLQRASDEVFPTVVSEIGGALR